MKQILLLSFCYFLLFKGYSQQRSIYAVSGQPDAPFNWSDIQKIENGQNQMLFANGKSTFKLIDAYSKEEVKKFTASFSQPQGSDPTTINISSPTFLMSAAMALDKKHNRLFFATMHSGHLLWLDLNESGKTPVFHLISDPILPNDNYADQALNITRMTIGADGNGYAISNDGNHLIRFSTGRKIMVSDLGMLLDDPDNKNISIHNQCVGWGGDVVGDASGKLILFTAGKNVFEIDIHSKVTKYLGSIQNLPAQFTVNGAAVDDDGKVILSSANVQDGFYKMDMSEMKAVKMNEAPPTLNASDLASANLLGQSFKKTGVAILPPLEAIGNEFITIYPNPIRNKNLKVSFDKNLPGTYNIAFIDLEGRLVQNKKSYIHYKGQMENMHFDKSVLRGFYLIRVTDVVNKEIFSGKIFVE